MKRIWIVLLAALLTMTLACGKEAQAAQAVVKADEPLSGGWTPAEDFSVTDERQAVLDKGLAELVGANYVPLAYLGSQVVAGTNHVFLCETTVVYPGATPTYTLVYLYGDLQGNVTLMNVADLPVVPNADGTLTVPEAGLSGGWYYAADPAFTDEDEAKLEAALQTQVGASYAIVAYVAEQVVAGLNRCLLVQVTPVVPDARPHYALAYVYTDLQGNSSLTQVVDLDIGAYCTYGA